MENQTKHAPGPWHIEDASFGQIICADKADVAIVRNADGLPHHANARLIAAAPALLAALESLMARDLENRLSGFVEVAQARAAIAAARGES